MKNSTLKKDLYDKIYDKIYSINTNIHNQYLDRVTEAKIVYPFITLKTSLEMANVGLKTVKDKGGKIRLIVYDTDYEAMCNLVSSITQKLEENDDEIYLESWDEDNDQLEFDGDKPYYTAIDISINIYPNGT